MKYVILCLKSLMYTLLYSYWDLLGIYEKQHYSAALSLDLLISLLLQFLYIENDKEYFIFLLWDPGSGMTNFDCR